MRLKYFLLILPILFWVGCEEDEAANGDGNVTVESVSGTYNITSFSVHNGGDCSDGAGVTGTCFPNPSSSEADCPTGVCNCKAPIEGVTTEEGCEDAGGEWELGEPSTCLGNCDATTEAECLAFGGADDMSSGEWYSEGFCMDRNGDGMDNIRETAYCNCPYDVYDEDVGYVGQAVCDSIGGDWNGMVCSQNCDATTEAECLAFGLGDMETPGEWYLGCSDTRSCDCSEVMSISNEESCDDVDGDWDGENNECLGNCDATTEAECLAFVGTDGANGNWRTGGAWVIFGWNLIANTYVSGTSVTLAADGTFTSTGLSDPGSENSGTWALDGSTIALNSPDAGYPPGLTATVSGNTITLELVSESNCSDDTGEYEAADEAECDQVCTGCFDAAECYAMSFTKSGS